MDTDTLRLLGPPAMLRPLFAVLPHRLGARWARARRAALDRVGSGVEGSGFAKKVVR